MFGSVNARWTWLFGIATGASFVFALIFFAATQNLTGRDVFAVTIGLVFGATLAAFISTFVFHRESRSRSIGEQNALAAKRLELVSALTTRSEEIARLAALVTELDAQAAIEDGERNSFAAAAKESTRHGFAADAAREAGQANAALHRAVGLRERRAQANAELDRLRGISDEEYLSQLKHLRGLD